MNDPNPSAILALAVKEGQRIEISMVMFFGLNIDLRSADHAHTRKASVSSRVTGSPSSWSVTVLVLLSTD
jgi:hypothetical protein